MPLRRPDLRELVRSSRRFFIACLFSTFVIVAESSSVIGAVVTPGSVATVVPGTPTSTASPCLNAMTASPSTWLPYLVFFLPLVFGALALAIRYGPRIGAPRKMNRQEQDDFEARMLVFGLTVLAGAGLFWIATVPMAGSSWVTVELASIGILASAGFFGFLFGLPHTNAGLSSTTDANQPILKTSTNLEQIADKLTQLLTGVALAELLTIPSYVSAFDQYVCSTGAPRPLGAAMLLFFAPLGFVLAYVFTRTVGTSAFAKYDSALWNSGREIATAIPMLPDVDGDPTDEQRAIALKIVESSLGDLQDDTQRITWGRAQAILGNYAEANLAFTTTYPRCGSDARFLYEFATALYNDPAFDDPEYVLRLAKKGDDIAAKALAQDTVLRGRLQTLIIATYLYGAGPAYIGAIMAANTLLQSNLQPTKLVRFYRACAFGQLYRAGTVSGPMPQQDQAAIERIINSDVAITIAFGPRYRLQVTVVIDPSKRTNPSDDDLQTIAAVSPTLCAQAGVQGPIATPTTPNPPTLALPPGTTIQTLVAQCPP